MTDAVTLVEVGPRDGLQNEPRVIATARKIDLIDQLAACGLTRIEVTSFVSPKWIPQLADAAEVMGGIARAPGVAYAALVPNMQGMKRALACAPDEIAVFTSASERFCRHNINCSIAESLDRFQPVVDLARDVDLPVRGYISCVTDCPYAGAVAPGPVAQLARRLIALGCQEVSLGDTLGAGTPERVDAMLAAVLDHVPAAQLAGHYHDTHGLAFDNILVSLQRGLRTFDCAIAGLGGCPYAPGAAGNVATEQVVRRLHGEGYDTGVDLDRLTSTLVPLAQTLRGTP